MDSEPERRKGATCKPSTEIEAILHNPDTEADHILNPLLVNPGAIFVSGRLGRER
jgi:hypothetical protein